MILPTAAELWGKPIMKLSALHEHGKKIHYFDFLMSNEYPECTKALLNIVPKINISEINTFIEGVPYLSDLQKKFYQTYLEARLKRLLFPAFIQAGGKLPE